MSAHSIGIFYGSSTCYTQMSAEKIAAVLNNQGSVDIHNIADESIANSLNYDLIIFGIPTWDYGELQEAWEEIWDEIDQLDYSGKVVALYGQGDQEGYPEWFLDAMGYLYHKLISLGAKVIGFWPNQGYSFDKSTALTEDGEYFVGLALDDETQFEESEARIAQWCQQIVRESGLGD